MWFWVLPVYIYMHREKVNPSARRDLLGWGTSGISMPTIRSDGTEPHAHRESDSASRGKIDGEETESQVWGLASVICNNNYPRAEILKYSNLWIPFNHI